MHSCPQRRFSSSAVFKESRFLIITDKENYMKKLIIAAAVAAVICSAGAYSSYAADSCTYEAESAYTGGWAVRLDDPSASAGAVVTHVGGTNTDVGTVVYNVWAETSGDYKCEFYYRSREDSSFYIRVNYPAWDSANDEKVTTSANSSIVSVEKTLYLNKGFNTVKVYSLEGIDKNASKDRRLDMDKLVVYTKGYTMSGITENTESGQGTERRAYMAEDQSVSANAVFNVSVPDDGTYDLNVWYNAAEMRAMQINVDGEKCDTLICPITAEDYNIETVSKKMYLTAGSHQISFINETCGIAPEIDKIQLVPSSADAKSGAKAAQSGVKSFANGIAAIEYDLETGRADYIIGGVKRLKGFEAAVKIENCISVDPQIKINSVVKSSDYTYRSVSETVLSDGFGKGVRYDVTSSGSGLPDMVQSFCLYEDIPYVLVQVSVSDGNGVSTNFMAPIAVCGAEVADIGAHNDVRALCVPYSNDNYSTYDPQRLGGSHTSYWYTCLVDAQSRNALVAGSIDHDTWKTGTSVYGTEDNGRVEFFGVFAGIWSREQTYDFLPHGSVDGTTVTSPKMFLGYFDDWRDGLEAYGEANNNNVPRLKWGGGALFGYSSWNAYQSSVSLDTMKTASDVISGLNSFCDENGTQWINIDSYWDNLSDSQLREYIDHCRAKGQKAGVYSARYICWDNDLWNWGRRGYAITDKYGNAVAPAKPDGSNITITDCFGIDPTSSFAKQEMSEYMNKWKEQGFEFLKADFLNFNAVEGVYSDPNIKTGLQAYNAGCAEIMKHVDTDKFFINYSIAPLFPYQYAHSRRISCDIATESNNMKEAEYMLNALNYSWWQAGTVYEFIDPDQLSFDAGILAVLSGDYQNRARAKYTTGVISGTMIVSNKYNNDWLKKATEAACTNEEVNKVARLGKAFRPVEIGEPCGYKNENPPSDIYTLKTAEAFYIAVFNYDPGTVSKTVDLVRAGLEPDVEYTLTDLWTGESVNAENFVSTSLKAYNCRLYKIASEADPEPDPTEKPGPTDDPNETTPVYLEDFEAGRTLGDIQDKTRGWSYGGNDSEWIDLWIGDCGSGSKSLRYTNGDKWFGATWLELDLRDNAAVKYAEAGHPGYEEIIDRYLSDNCSLSFRIKFEVQGSDPSYTHEQYIRIKGINGESLAELHLRGERLYLEPAGTADAPEGAYEIKRVNISTGNNEWHSFKIDLDYDSNTYRLSVDGAVFEIPGSGADITACESGNDMPVLNSIEFGHSDSGWWQCMYIDDIEITPLPHKEKAEWQINDIIFSEADGSYRIRCTKGSGDLNDVKLIAALYSGDVLIGVHIYSADDFDGSEFEAESAMGLPPGGGKVTLKAFLWADGMCPAARSKTADGK